MSTFDSDIDNETSSAGMPTHELKGSSSPVTSPYNQSSSRGKVPDSAVMTSILKSQKLFVYYLQKRDQRLEMMERSLIAKKETPFSLSISLLNVLFQENVH